MILKFEADVSIVTMYLAEQENVCKCTEDDGDEEREEEEDLYGYSRYCDFPVR